MAAFLLRYVVNRTTIITYNELVAETKPEGTG